VDPQLDEAWLLAEMRRAMKERDTTRVNVVRGIVAAIKNAKIDERVAELPAAEIGQLIRREMKKREEVTEIARRGQRTDVVEQNEIERAILESFLPTGLTPEETETAIRQLCAAGASSIGDIMRQLRAEHPGRIDGKSASEIARRVLSETVQ
jgi:uncharacterized protein YqeY